MKKIYLIIIGILLAGIAGLLYMHNKDHDDLSIQKHNLETAMDSINILTLKNGDQVSTINSYILENEQLDKYLDINKKELSELEKKVGKTGYISNIKTVLKYDSIIVRDTITMIDDTIIHNIIYNDEWMHLFGKSIIYDKQSLTTIDSINIPAPLQVGITNDYKIWVKSKNPYIQVSSMEGAVIKNSRLYNKPKRWGIGIHGGLGVQYGLINKKVDVGPYVGVGISYNLFSW